MGDANLSPIEELPETLPMTQGSPFLGDELFLMRPLVLFVTEERQTMPAGATSEVLQPVEVQRMLHQRRAPALGFGIAAREALQRRFERGQRFSGELNRPQMRRGRDLPDDFSLEIPPVQSLGADLIAPDFLKRRRHGLGEITDTPAGAR